MIHFDELPAEVDATHRAEGHPDDHNREGKFEIVGADLPVAKPARFQHRDLLTLQRDLATHH